jgi:hypothetical protein
MKSFSRVGLAVVLVLLVVAIVVWRFSGKRNTPRETTSAEAIDGLMVSSAGQAVAFAKERMGIDLDY